MVVVVVVGAVVMEPATMMMMAGMVENSMVDIYICSVLLRPLCCSQGLGLRTSDPCRLTEIIFNCTFK